MYEPRNSIRRRAIRVARQRGLIGEGAGVLPLVLTGLVVFGVLWLAFAITGFVFSLIPTLLIGLIAGWAGSRLVGTRLGTGWTVLAGIVGSLIGGPLILGTAATVLASLSTAWLRTDTRLEAAVTVAVGSVVFLGFYFSTAVMWGHLPRHYFSWPLR